jgi:hypothetical protein
MGTIRKNAYRSNDEIDAARTSANLGVEGTRENLRIRGESEGRLEEGRTVSETGEDGGKRAYSANNEVEVLESVELSSGDPQETGGGICDTAGSTLVC